MGPGCGQLSETLSRLAVALEAQGAARAAEVQPDPEERRIRRPRGAPDPIHVLG